VAKSAAMMKTNATAVVQNDSMFRIGKAISLAPI
jgi:hypothetical protein